MPASQINPWVSSDFFFFYVYWTFFLNHHATIDLKIENLQLKFFLLLQIFLFF